MNLSGQAQAELVKIAAIAVAVLVAALVVKRGLSAAGDAAGQLVDHVLALPGQAYEAAADAVRVDVPPLAEGNTYSERVEERWQQVEQGQAKPSFWYDVTHIFNFD